MKTKNEYRNDIIKLIEKKKGTMIHCDKDILENAIFNTYLVNNNIVRIPMWTGRFLRNIDLSEISFDNVLWDITSIIPYDYFICLDENAVSQDKTDLLNLIKLVQLQDDDFSLILFNFSNTNAQIDFSKSNAILNGSSDLSVSFCSFENVDLSKSNAHYITCIDNCFFDNSKANFDFDAIKNIYASTFTGIDLSNKQLDITKLSLGFKDNITDFRNTNITIKYDSIFDIIKEYKYYPEILAVILDNFWDKIYSGNFDGCFFNEKFLLGKVKDDSNIKKNDLIF